MTDSTNNEFPTFKREARYANVSKLLGMNITLADVDKGIVEASFETKEIFHNYIGNIQGGILTAMLDDLMGYAVNIMLPENQFAPTGNLNVSFLRSAKEGKLSGRGEVLKQEGDIFHLAAKLYNDAGELICSSTSRAKIVDIT